MQRNSNCFVNLLNQYSPTRLADLNHFDLNHDLNRDLNHLDFFIKITDLNHSHRLMCYKKYFCLKNDFSNENHGKFTHLCIERHINAHKYFHNSISTPTYPTNPTVQSNLKWKREFPSFFVNVYHEFTSLPKT